MKTSESITKLAPAILQAQKAITFAIKEAVNGHLRNKYADLSSVIEAIKPALNDAGISFIQSGTESDDSKLHLVTRLMHESGEWIEDTLVMPLPKQDPQGYGSAMTYARRYALAAITGLYQDDDDGQRSVQAPAQQAAPKKALTQKIADVLIQSLKNKTTTIQQIEDEYAIKPEQRQRIIDAAMA